MACQRGSAQLDVPATDESSDLLPLVRCALDHAIHLLPTQGPIAVFVHHNTLHAFEHHSFHEAVLEGWQTFHCQPYFSEKRFREEMGRGRIDTRDLDAILREDLQQAAHEEIVLGRSRIELRATMLRYPILSAPTSELRWYIAETNAIQQFRSEVSDSERRRLSADTRSWVLAVLKHPESAPRLVEMFQHLFTHLDLQKVSQWDDAIWETVTLQLLWQMCHQGAQAGHAHETHGTIKRRLREDILRITQRDPDLLANDLLIRFTSAYLDQGFASWSLPNRERGIFQCFLEVMGSPSWLGDSWLQQARRSIQEERHAQLTPIESIAVSLKALHIPSSHWDEYITESLLALSGWAGMIWQMETNADWTLRPAPAGSLEGYLAIRLLLDRAASESIAREHFHFSGSVTDLLKKIHREAKQHATATDDREQRAFLLFQVSQLLGWGPRELFSLSRQEWSRLVGDVEAFGALERRRAFQLAYERHYRVAVLDAIATHADQKPLAPEKPLFQLVTCIDDREESLRRHVEEVDPRVETYGAAGFFNVPMYFRGVSDAHFIPLCPIVVKPQHYVAETPASWLEHVDRKRAATRKTIGRASHRVHMGSRGFFAGTLAAFVGTFASLPMVMRVLFPRLTARMRAFLGSVVQPPEMTQLVIERTEETTGPDNGHRGYRVEEMAAMAKRFLEDTGLANRCANLVLILGHGSSSLNNPHESAYNCGACGGGRGGPNARALADICNDARVRALLADQGIFIPSTAWFLGGYHNTCDDQIQLYDLERSPPAHRSGISQALTILDEARQRNAHERCRRFESAPLDLSPKQALRHVEARSEDLAQARPEYNHATNAVCMVGRRGRTRCLFLDRRTFLTSYDPTRDDANGTILNRILQAVIPVCGGISLEYYFSCVDPAGYGCGSKLPHNIASMLGVMEGALSDLRTGLSQQMVEIHEPMRILFLIETRPEILLRIFESNPQIQQMVGNDWVQIATLDPDSSAIQVLRDGRFVAYVPQDKNLSVAETSIDWYQGQRDHLGFAKLEAGNPYSPRRY